jgi:hypothetical protein
MTDDKYFVDTYAIPAARLTSFTRRWAIFSQIHLSFVIAPKGRPASDFGDLTIW